MNTRRRIKWTVILPVVVFFWIFSPAIASPKSDSDKMIVKTVEGKTLVDLVSDQLAAISSPSVVPLLCGGTLATVNEEPSNGAIALGQVFRQEQDRLVEPLTMGKISLRLGSDPLSFKLEKHQWSYPIMQSEFVCQNSALIRRFRLVRNISVNDKGRSFVLIKITVPGSRDSMPSIMKDLRVRYEAKSPWPAEWRMIVRLPDKTVKNIDKNLKSFECGLGEAENVLLFGVELIKNTPPRTKDMSVDSPSLEKTVKTLKTSALLQGMYKKKLLGCFPGWDCPEPWLNRLWAAQIQAIRMQWTPSSPISFTPVLNTIHREDANRVTGDLQWCTENFSHDRFRIKAILAVQKPSLLPTYDISDETALVSWCRSMYHRGDFNCPIDLAISEDMKTVKANLPAGVIDTVVRGIVGLQADGTNRLKIHPPEWLSRWRYFAIDNLPYLGHNLTIVWQSPKADRRYLYMDVGWNVFVDGKLIRHSDKPEFVEDELK